MPVGRQRQTDRLYRVGLGGPGGPAGQIPGLRLVLTRQGQLALPDGYDAGEGGGQQQDGQSGRQRAQPPVAAADGVVFGLLGGDRCGQEGALGVGEGGGVVVAFSPFPGDRQPRPA